jgi:hypothetical protein
MRSVNVLWQRCSDGEWRVRSIDDTHACTHLAEMASLSGRLCLIETEAGNSIGMWDAYLADTGVSTCLPQHKQGGQPKAMFGCFLKLALRTPSACDPIESPSPAIDLGW